MLSTLSRFRTSWHGVLALFVGIIIILYVMEPLTMSGAQQFTSPYYSTELQLVLVPVVVVALLFAIRFGITRGYVGYQRVSTTPSTPDRFSSRLGGALGQQRDIEKGGSDSREVSIAETIGDLFASIVETGSVNHSWNSLASGVEEHLSIAIVDCAQRDASGLSALLSTVDVGALVAALQKPKYFFGALQQSHMQKLTIDAKANLIVAAATRPAEGGDRSVLALFRTCAGVELSLLKRRVEQGVDFCDLVYSNMQDADARESLLKHFQENAVTGIKSTVVVSDIDDTVYASFKDSRYPRGTSYPGLRQFYTELCATTGGRESRVHSELARGSSVSRGEGSPETLGGGSSNNDSPNERIPLLHRTSSAERISSSDAASIQPDLKVGVLEDNPYRSRQQTVSRSSWQGGQKEGSMRQEGGAAATAAAEDGVGSGCSSRDDPVVVFLTARPGFLKGRTLREMEEMGFGNPTILTGSITQLVGHRSMGEEKARNYQKYRRLYPECLFVFVGDNGQGDIDAGKVLLADETAGVAGVFIHDIYAPASQGEKPHRLDECEQAGIVLFQTYAGAAAAAAKAGLMELQAAMRVVEVTLRDLRKIDFGEDQLGFLEGLVLRDAAGMAGLFHGTGGGHGQFMAGLANPIGGKRDR